MIQTRTMAYINIKGSKVNHIKSIKLNHGKKWQSIWWAFCIKIFHTIFIISTTGTEICCFNQKKLMKIFSKQCQLTTETKYNKLSWSIMSKTIDRTMNRRKSFNTLSIRSTELKKQESISGISLNSQGTDNVYLFNWKSFYFLFFYLF